MLVERILNGEGKAFSKGLNHFILNNYFLKSFIQKEKVVEGKHRLNVRVKQGELNGKKYSQEKLKSIFCGKNCVNVKEKGKDTEVLNSNKSQPGEHFVGLV